MYIPKEFILQKKDVKKEYKKQIEKAITLLQEYDGEKVLEILRKIRRSDLEEHENEEIK